MEEYWLWQWGWCLRNKGLCLLLNLVMIIIVIIVLLASYRSIPPMFFYPLLAFSVSYLFTILAVGGGFFSRRTSLRIYRVSTGIIFLSVSAIPLGFLYIIVAHGGMLIHPFILLYSLLLLIIGLVFLLLGMHRIYSGLK